MSMKVLIGKIWATRRAAHLHRSASQALKLQERTFRYLIRRGRKTTFGEAHDFAGISSLKDFQSRVPVRDYEAAKSWFDRIYRNEASVTWPGRPLYLAKTSGTTSGTKYIPITRESIRNQISAARDALLCYLAETGNGAFLDGKMMFLSGSPEIGHNPYGVRTGRLSGIVNHFVPAYLQTNKVPGYATNCLPDWEEKVRQIVAEVHDQDLRLISGIPPWVQMLFEELEAQTGKRPLEAWPNLQLFVQGGVNFAPYRPIFDGYFQGRVAITEVFPASEGFFAIQTRQGDEGLLLLPDNGVFYEFIPLESYGAPDAPRYSLAEVEMGRQYALILTTNAGLWAYDIGDTVVFTSLDPWKIRVSGRVKHFISAFGEHVIAEEVNAAILAASGTTGARFQEFTVAPYIAETKGQSYHEWLIEFAEPPRDMETFAEVLDQALRQRNSYYDDLRAGNILLRAQVRQLSPHASREYMKSQGKLGGQNKFPRLSNDRRLADALTPYIMD